MKFIIDNKLKVKIDKDNIKIIDSYKISDKKEMKKILKSIFEKDPYKETRIRKLSDSLLEWRTHNILYNFHLFRTHTTDCDLEEKEQLHRMFAYKILGRL